MAAALRVHLADEHAMFREGLDAIFSSRGLSNCRIAQELYLSDTTVKRHLANVYEKMGVSSRNEAVRKALMEELIGLHEIAATDGRAD